MPKKGDAITLRISGRELATILAALRFHQAENLQGTGEIPDQFIREIATDAGRFMPMGFQGINNLCQRLNVHEDTRPAHHAALTLYEVESNGRYHEHWLAFSHLDVVRRAIAHAKETGLTLDRVAVSSMREPEERSKGGLVYVVNDTATYAIERGRVRRIEV
jgi:hypothetical protein